MSRSSSTGSGIEVRPRHCAGARRTASRSPTSLARPSRVRRRGEPGAAALGAPQATGRSHPPARRARSSRRRLFPSGHATYAGATCVALVLLFTTPGTRSRWRWALRQPRCCRHGLESHVPASPLAHGRHCRRTSRQWRLTPVVRHRAAARTCGYWVQLARHELGGTTGRRSLTQCRALLDDARVGLLSASHGGSRHGSSRNSQRSCFRTTSSDVRVAIDVLLAANPQQRSNGRSMISRVPMPLRERESRAPARADQPVRAWR